MMEILVEKECSKYLYLLYHQQVCIKLVKTTKAQWESRKPIKVNTKAAGLAFDVFELHFDTWKLDVFHEEFLPPSLYTIILSVQGIVIAMIIRLHVFIIQLFPSLSLDSFRPTIVSKTGLFLLVN